MNNPENFTRGYSFYPITKKRKIFRGMYKKIRDGLNAFVLYSFNILKNS